MSALDPPPAGSTASLTVTVTEETTARFDDEDVHDVYGTAALVRHVEQVSRRLLTPCLEPHEEGVGATISVRQHAPVRVGERVELVATVTEADARRLVTSVVARHAGRVVAEATFTQAAVDRAAFRARAGLPEE